MTKHEILENLRNKILEEKFEQGQSLVERELCEIFNVSRTPMREILWKLVLDGIVEQRPSRGFFVRKLDWEQIFEIFQTREAIEGMATRLSCQRHDPELIDDFKRMITELEAVDILKNPRDGGRIGRSIHNDLIVHSSNRFLREFYEKIGYLAKLTTNISIRSSSIEEVSKKSHLSIMKAVIDGDADKSEMLMRDHLRITCRNIIETFYPQVFSGTLIDRESPN